MVDFEIHKPADLSGPEPKEKRQKIKNKFYKDLISGNQLQLLDSLTINRALNNVSGINGKYIKEGRALLISLFLTGARPAELMLLRTSNFRKSRQSLIIFIPTLKQGTNRTIELPFSNPMVKELWDFIATLYPEMLLFYHYRSAKRFKYKLSSVKHKGEERSFKYESSKLWYHIRKWFNGIVDLSPYVFRHNLFSSFAEDGYSLEEIRQWKGSKTIASVIPYSHLSHHTAHKMSKSKVFR